MLLINWLKSIACKCRPTRPRFIRNQRSRALQRFQSVQSQRINAIEQLEDRTMLTSVITIDDVSIEEDAGLSIVIFTLTRTGTNPGDLNSSVEINFTTQDGTATGNDVDYNSVTGTLYFFSSATATSQTTTMHVGIEDDTNAEGDETFHLVLSTDAPDTVITKNVGTATIIDDDAISLSINDASGYEYESLTFTVSLNRPAESDITFLAKTWAGSATSTASLPDYTFLDNKLFTIRAGELSKEITIYPKDDDRAEPDETFSVQIYDPRINGESQPDFLSITDDTGAGTILNDDRLPGSVFRMEGSKVSEGDNGIQTLKFYLKREGGVKGDLNFDSTVEFQTSDGTAVAGEDYEETVVTLHFSASPTEISQTMVVNVPVFGDKQHELSETLFATISNPSGGSILLGNVDALQSEGSITNDETEFSFQQSFSASPEFADHSYGHTGRQLALFEDILVFGAPNNYRNQYNAPGAAYIYVRNQQGTPSDQTDDTWDYETFLSPDDQPELTYFGSAVAIDLDTIVIGGSKDGEGMVYVYTKVGADWKTIPPLREVVTVGAFIDNPEDFFHSPLGISENTIIAGSWIIEKTGTDWSAHATRELFPTNNVDTYGDTRFGWSAAISGNIIVIGAPGDSERDENAGAAYVFIKKGDDWTTIAPDAIKLTASESYFAGASFGMSVATNGTEVAVGATYKIGLAYQNYYAGNVYVYSPAGPDWTNSPPLESLFYASYSAYGFGGTISLTDTELIVGAISQREGVGSWGTESGKVYRYTKQGDTWNRNTASSSLISVYGHFGETIAFSGSTLVVGRPLESTAEGFESGIVNVYELNQDDNFILTSEIVPTESQTAHNGGDGFGNTMAVSEKYLVIGAPFSERLSSIDPDLMLSGVVYIYAKDDGGTPDNSNDDRWVYQTTLEAPETDFATGFGRSIAIDGDTILVAASSRRLDNTGTRVFDGEVYIYEMSGADWTTMLPTITPLLKTVGRSIDWYHTGYFFSRDFIAIDNDTIVVGNTFTDGVVYIYTRNGTNWSSLPPSETTLGPAFGSYGDRFGYTLAIDNDKIIVGGYESSTYRQIAYLYEKGENGWNTATETKLAGYNSLHSDSFGTSLAISGNTIAIGAYSDREAGSNAGAVYIYDGSNGWRDPVEIKLTPDNVKNHDPYNTGSYQSQSFGLSLDLDHDLLVVGTGWNLYSPESSAVYLYDGSEGWDRYKKTQIPSTSISPDYDAAFGSQVAIQKNNILVTSLSTVPDSEVSQVYSFTRLAEYENLVLTQSEFPPLPVSDGDHFGNQIEVEGDYMFVAAIDSALEASYAGAVYIYQRNRHGTPDVEYDDTWDYHSTLTAPNAVEGDQYGISIASDGDTLVIGAYRDDEMGEDSGAAYVYRLNGSSWELEEKLIASDADAGDYFGVSVAIENDTILVGASYWDSSFITNNYDDGAAYVFTRTGSNWSETQRLTASNNNILDRFGNDVAIQNGTLFVSAVSADAGDSTPDAGAVYLFEQIAGTWQEQQILGPPDGEHNDVFGSDIHVDGDYLGVVAFGDDDNKGSAYLFVNNAGTWEFQQKLVPPTDNDADRSVFSLRISGQTLVIGGRYSDGLVSDSGAAFLYKITDNQWVETQKLFATDGAFQDFFGYAVAFSDTEVIIGTPLNDEAGNDVGKLYVFGPLAPEISISDISQIEGDTGQSQFTFTIERRGQFAGDLNFDSTVIFSTADLSATVADGDYEFLSGTVTFTGDSNATVQTQTITILVNGDLDLEGQESFLVQLSDPSFGTRLQQSEARGWIEEDDITLLSIEDITVNEDAGTANITVSLNKASSGQIQVAIRTSDLSAMSPNDYLGASGTLTFNAGELSKTFSVSIFDNSSIEADKKFLVDLSNLQTESQGVQISDSQASVTILEDDYQAIISTNDITANEADGSAAVLISFKKPVETTVSIDFTTSAQSAIAQKDFINTSGTITFNPGDQTKTIFIPIINDTVVEEPQETFVVNLSNIQSADPNVIFDNSQSVVTIIDNEQAHILIADQAINEIDGSVTLTVLLGKPVDIPVTLDYFTSRLTANDPDDFLAQSGSLTFSPGEQSKNIIIDIVDSALVELDETFLINLANIQTNGANVIFSQDHAAVTIHDDDQANLSISDLTVDENVGTATITVTLDRPVDSIIAIDYATADQSATDPDDYLSTSGTLIFSPGEQSKTITVSIVDTDLVESDESFFVNLINLQANGRNVILAENQAKVTILNDDQANISINDLSIDETAGTAILTVSLDKPIETTISVDFTTADQTAVVTDDYQSQAGTLTFDPGEQTKTITVPIINSDVVEADETFLIKLSNLQANGANVVIADNEAEVMIMDDDQAKISINDLTIIESAGKAVLTVSLDQPAETIINVDFTTEDQSAIAPDDYTQLSGTIVFNPGEQTKTITIDIVDSDLLEAEETFFVNLTSIQANGANVIFDDAQAEITIQDDDQAQLSVSDLTVNETDGTALITVSMDKPINTAVSIDFTTVDQTSYNSIDYSFQNGTLTFNPGEQTKTIMIDILDDAVVEVYETFLLRLSNFQTTSPDVILTDDEAIVTIQDDDFATFSIDDITVNENDGTATLKVSLNRAVYLTLTIDYATADASATNPNDYSSQAGTLTFYQGQRSRYITIPLLDSDLVEGSESFLVNLSNIHSSSAQVNIADHQAVVTIIDDEVANLTVNDFSVDESAGTVDITVSLDQPVETSVSIDFSTADQTAIESDDYQATSGTLTFNPGEQTQTITVPVVYSDLVELDETFLINLTNLQANGANIIQDVNQVTVTIADHDQAEISIADVSVDENAGTATLTVSLDSVVDTTVSVDFATANQTANTPDDYQAISGTLTFNPGEQTKSITVSIADSDLLEADETFLVNLFNLQANGRNVTLADNQAEVTIIDDEIGAAEINLRVVNSPTDTQPNGEAGSLPENQTWVSEWSSYWVEIWINASYPTEQGVYSAALDFHYNTEYTSATEIEYGAAFTQNQTGSINDLTGTVEGLSAETNASALGIDNPLLFARIKFEPLAEDQVSLDLEGKSIGPYDLGFGVSSQQVSLDGAIPATTSLGAFNGTSIYANPLDFNDNDEINFRDLIIFASVYNSTPSQSSSDYSWFADINQSNEVNFRDLILFASNYGKSKLSHSPVNYPDNYPDAWNHLLSVEAQSEPSSAPQSITQSTAETVLENVVDGISATLTPSESETLKNIDIQVVDLDGDTLGRAAAGTIYIDVNAAGYGWFVDNTPADHSEFAWDSALTLIALPGSEAENHIDLRTVILHELGHILGYDHENEGVMQDKLAPGVRNIPTWDEEADHFFSELTQDFSLTNFLNQS